MTVSEFKSYGYIICIVGGEVVAWMLLHVGEPKDERYWLGLVAVSLFTIGGWLGRSPENFIKTWQKPSVKELMETDPRSNENEKP